MGSVSTRMGTLRALFNLLNQGGRRWMLVLAAALALVGLLMIGLQSIEYVAPFIYVIF